MENLELYRLFVSCMAAFLQGEKVHPALSAQDWGRLYTLAKRQSLSGALHAATDGCDMPDTVRDRLRRDAFLTLTSYETQQQVLRELCDTLSAAGIAHLLFKGAAMRRFYRTPAMRSMGDIDAAVHLSARAMSDTALREAGFAKTKEQPEVWVYQKNGVLLELHTTVRRYHSGLQETVPYETLWTDARLKNGCTHHLSDDAHAAYILSHMASHFCGGGCGLRQLMDVAVLYEAYPDVSLWHSVLTRLEKTVLDTFARHMLWLCREWFGVAVDDSLMSPLPSDVEAAMLTRLLGDSTFGADEHHMLARMRQDRRLHQNSGKLGMLTRWLFPSPSYIKRQYAYAEHPLLLPAAYVHRLFDGVTKHRRQHTARLQYAKANTDALESEVRLFEEIGL